jgi:endonuclease/exonuclease/phosphatase family metal-dependent hydrolase
MSFTLVSTNIEVKNHLHDRVIPFVEKIKPDFISFQEVHIDDVSVISEKLGMDAHFAPMTNVLVPNIHNQTLGIWGVAQFVRPEYKAEFHHREYVGTAEVLPEFTETNNNSMNRVLGWFKVQLPNRAQPLIVATTHFTWSPKGEFTDLQKENLASLLQLLDEVQPSLFSGDFNSPRAGKPDNAFNTLVKRYKDNIPSEVTTSIDPDLHKAGALQLMVDGCFSTPDVQVNQVEVMGGVSDHKAVVINFDVI